ncbi:MAG TPA: hypothetical protein VIE41_07620 [Methylomirabilota bacterium]|jgi:hypothetical protein
MESNVYAVELMAAERLADLRAACARAALVAAAQRSRPGMAAVLGTALIRAGEWLARGEAGAVNAGVRVARRA